MNMVIIDKEDQNQILITIISEGGDNFDWGIPNRQIKEIKDFLQRRANEQHVSITFPEFYPKYGAPL